MNEERKTLSPKEAYELKKREKEELKKKRLLKEKAVEAPRKIGKTAFRAFLAVGIIGGAFWLMSRAPYLPPTTTEGHIEASPAAHIVTAPIPDRVQRHMLEHADGSGSPGIIIQYNCDNYACEPDLINRLTALVEEYPEHVYLAPNVYDGKIILTKIGSRKVLDEFDEQAIRDFIE